MAGLGGSGGGMQTTVLEQNKKKVKKDPRFIGENDLGASSLISTPHWLSAVFLVVWLCLFVCFNLALAPLN